MAKMTKQLRSWMRGGKSEAENRIHQKKVGFLIAGVQKAGTSSLHGYLREHPDLYLPEKKELHFFDNEEIEWGNIQRGSRVLLQRTRKVDPYAKYHEEFEGGEQEKTWGEATPIYLYWKECMSRIKNYNQKMRIVIILRNPITRAFSQWNMEYSRGLESREFYEALQQELLCRNLMPEYQHRIQSYISRGHYISQLKRMWDCFDRDQTLIIKQEDLMQRPEEMLAKVYRHIGVKVVQPSSRRLDHAIPYRSQMPAAARELLLKEFENEIGELERMLGWDCSEWIKG